MKQHSFDLKLSKHRFMFYYCSRCGLIAMNNEATRKAMKKPCPGRED